MANPGGRVAVNDTRLAGRRLGYRPQLDGIRAFAVCAVMFYHLYLPLGGGGWIGVDIFFMLSGFLITSLLLEEWAATAKISLTLFYMRRALRLLPALAVLLLTTLLISVALSKSISTEAVVTVALYVGNWPAALHNLDMGPLGQCWSLGIEEQFYVIWPIAFVLLLRRTRDLSKIAVVLVAGICSAWLLGLLLFNGRNYGRLYFGTDTRAAALLIGCLGAVVFKSGWLVKISRRAIELATVAAFAALAIFAFTRYNITQYPGISLYFGVIDLVALVLVLRVLECPEGFVAQLSRTRPFTAIGRLSYGLYPWNFLVDHLLEAKLHQSKAAVISIELVLTAALAVASFSIVERPFLRLKRHFGGRVAATSGAAV